MKETVIHTTYKMITALVLHCLAKSGIAGVMSPIVIKEIIIMMHDAYVVFMQEKKCVRIRLNERITRIITITTTF